MRQAPIVALFVAVSAQDDLLCQAYYDGGVRVVDVSGELSAGGAIAVKRPFRKHRVQS